MASGPDSGGGAPFFSFWPQTEHVAGADGQQAQQGFLLSHPGQLEPPGLPPHPWAVDKPWPGPGDGSREP